VSELATNAVRHAATPYTVTIQSRPLVRIEVSDDSLDVPAPRFPAATDPGGRGLLIVAESTVHWGVKLVGRGKVVWAEVAASSTGGSNTDARRAESWPSRVLRGSRNGAAMPGGARGGARVRWCDSRVVARLRGEIDLANADELFTAIRSAANGHEGIVIDLDGVTFLDSVGIAQLVGLAQQIAISIVAPPGREPERVLQLARVNGVIPVVATLDDALHGDETRLREDLSVQEAGSEE
jgi:anti-anti-sigma factor